MCDNLVYLPNDFFDWIMEDASPEVRVSGLSLMITSSHVTRPLSRNHLALLETHLPHMFGETDPHFRGEIFSLLKSLVRRVHAASASLARKHQQLTGQTSSTRLSESHDNALTMSLQLAALETFVSWLHEHATSNLHTCAPYQRRLSGLLVLDLLVKSGLNPDSLDTASKKKSSQDVPWPFKFTVI